MYALRAIGREVPLSEDRILPGVLSMMLQLPPLLELRYESLMLRRRWVKATFVVIADPRHSVCWGATLTGLRIDRLRAPTLSELRCGLSSRTAYCVARIVIVS
jgi:hypothetical protein